MYIHVYLPYVDAGGHRQCAHLQDVLLFTAIMLYTVHVGMFIHNMHVCPIFTYVAIRSCIHMHVCISS